MQKKESAPRGWGGSRPGAGPPKKPVTIKKRQVGLALPDWLIKKIDDLQGSRAKEIEGALCRVHGWQPPEPVGTEN